MKPTRLTAPSFKLRKAGTVVISESGRYLAQSGSRACLWDTKKREPLSGLKVTSHGHRLAISSDDAIVAVKSTSGEIVFVELSTSRSIARTGRYKKYQQGADPQFLSGAHLLLDGDWDGVLRLFDANSAQAVSSFRFDGDYMVTRIERCQARNRFVVAVNAKHVQAGGARLVLYDGPIALDAPTELRPRKLSQMHDGGWRHIQALAIHPNGERIAVALSGRTAGDPNTIEIIDLTSRDSRTIALPSRSHYVHGIAWSASGLLCVSIWENLYRPGQTFKEQVRDMSIEHCHVCFFAGSSLVQVARWPWDNAWSVSFAPNDAALVVGSEGEPGAYIGRRHLVSAGLPL